MKKIQFKDFSFGFNDNSIFDNINFEIKTDEITILSGSNGSGKTTLCRLLMGFLKDYSGQLSVDDIENKTQSTVEISNFITYIKQEPSANVVSAFPAEDLEIWLHKFIGNEIESAKVVDALKYFGLEAHAKQPIWELSNGQLKRVGLSSLLLNTDKFWILDEPTAGLDDLLIDKLLTLIKNQKNRNKGMIIISHRSEKFIDVADNFIEIENKKFRMKK